ncbi:MAG: hypothetical protein IKI97_13905 [Clostridia bacterium]|nr:hypothetical protein [Clostridia bacterium]
MINLKGKKLLVIGGAFQHCKVVEAAHEMGVEVYVVDFLKDEDSPAKQIADHSMLVDVKNVAEMKKICTEEKIDGAIALCLDVCQRPYQQLCEEMGYPCFGNYEQYNVLTDKTAFKKCCIENGVDVIPEYAAELFRNNSDETCDVEYPVLVKPCDSRGSRGSKVCYNYNEVLSAIEEAKKESSNGQVLIEKYMGNKNDICISYVVINGKVYLTRVGDRKLGRIEDKMERVSMMGMAPSVYTEMYVNNVNEKVAKMLKNIGLKNAPAFMQGFVDGDTVRFYDPGLRYPGAEYERMYERVHGVSLVKPLIEFALTGEISDETVIPVDGYLQKGKKTPYLLVSVRPGKISRIWGEDEVRNHPAVVSMSTKYKAGDEVGEHYNVNQRFCEIDLVCEDTEDLKNTISWIYDTLIIEDENGENMVFSKVDINTLE